MDHDLIGVAGKRSKGHHCDRGFQLLHPENTRKPICKIRALKEWFGIDSKLVKKKKKKRKEKNIK